MIENSDFCTKEVSMLLKKLGYKERSFCYYTPSGDKLIHNTNSFRGGWFEDSSYCYNSLPEGCMCADFIDVPLIYEAQKWLRKNYNVELDSMKVPSKGNVYAYMVWIDDVCIKDSEACFPEKNYPTWEECMNQALKFAIEEIEFMKEEPLFDPNPSEKF
jgi:hypothetical protein